MIMISASIVLYNTSKDELSQVLHCTKQSIVERIFVIDNSPSDELRDFVVGFGSKVEYIFGQGNVGYGAAHNIAIRKSIESGVKYHIVLNPDIYFSDGTIENLANYMEQNQAIGQLMPKVVYPSGELQHLCKLLPSPIDLISRRFVLIKNYVENRNEKYELRFTGYDIVMEVPFLSGCFMLMRVDALKEVGGFDDRFFMYCEDIDLCRRVGMAGYRTVYYPEVTIVHAHRKESFNSKVMLKVHIKSAIRYFNKWGWLFDNYRKTVNKEILRKYCK